MPASTDFVYYAARKLLLNEAMPWATWEIVPLTKDMSDERPDVEYDSEWEAFDPKTIGNWSIQPWVPAVDEPPVAEILPYAYITVPPSEWLNESSIDVIVRSIAVISSDGVLLFWKNVTETIVKYEETFAITEFKFKFFEVADGYT